MSIFKRAGRKIRKRTKKIERDVRKAAEETGSRIEKAAKETGKGIAQGAEQAVDNLEDGAESAKEGLQEAGDFVVNSTDRAYWDKQISGLRNRLNELREDLHNKLNDYYDVRIEYQSSVHYYTTIKQDTIALGLISLGELDEVTDTAGIVFDTSRDFALKNSDIAETGRLALGTISLGISDIIFASQEAKKEERYLKKQVAKLEESLEKIDQNIVKHEKGLALREQLTSDVFQLYGADTTAENFIEKQCAFLYAQAKDVAIKEASIRMQEKGVSPQEIADSIANI